MLEGDGIEPEIWMTTGGKCLMKSLLVSHRAVTVVKGKYGDGMEDRTVDTELEEDIYSMKFIGGKGKVTKFSDSSGRITLNLKVVTATQCPCEN